MQLYELRPDGGRKYRRALLEIPKGNGKTPLSAWVGAYELCHRDSAVIPVAAASYDQADLLFGDLRDCVRESPTLRLVLDAYESEIQVKGGSGSAYKVAAIAGTNDGQRPSCFLADEIHEWLGNKARVHVVIANGVSKRAGGFTLNTTTPGYDLDSLAGRLHEYGLKVNAGELVDDEFLFVWYGCPDDRYDLSDPDAPGFQDRLHQAIRDANPAADAFLDVASVAARFFQIDRHDFYRYHLGLWTSVQKLWLPSGSWEALARPGHRVEAGEDVVLGLDGSYNNDSTALVLSTCEATPFVDIVGVWERPDEAGVDWKVPILDVEQAIRDACAEWAVREVVCDPYRWARSIELLDGEGFPMVEFPQSPARMVPASARFEEAVINGQLVHSGNPILARHVRNCVVKEDARGKRIVKDSKHSTRKIDLAVAAVMAHERACQQQEDEGPTIW